MVQDVSLYNWIDDRRWENEESLKKYLAAHYDNIRTREVSCVQLTTAAYVELMEVSGETVVFPAAAATVLIYQKTDKVGTDGGAIITIEYITIAGLVKTVTVALDAADTTTEVAVCDDFFRLRRLETSIIAGDEILLGTTLAGEIYGVIKVACWSAVISRHYCPASTRTFLVGIDAIGPHTNPSSVQLTCNIVGRTLASLWDRADYVSTTWYSNPLLWELEPLTDVILQIKKNADANHANIIVRFKIIEAS